MKIISRQECQEWLKAKLARDLTWETVPTIYPHCVTYRLPTDTGKKTALAHVVIGSVDVTEMGLLWITAWSIFPSSENMLLFNGYRSSLGETRDVHAAPAHTFGMSDLPNVECLLDLVLYFYWDAILLDGSGILVRASHDEYISIHASEEASLQEFKTSLARLKLEQLT
jgi:hypothetical protein